MNMDDAQKQLFGRFPRSVGNPEQHLVHNESEFDLFTETVQGARNAYSSLSWFPLHSGVVCDKVSFDLDSEGKEAAFEEGLRDDEKIELMHENPDLANKVLGAVCDEARALAKNLLTCDYPVMGVFSGFGIHIHALTEPEEGPAEKMGSMARYWREHLGLDTLDHKPIGDEQRIMRVPNMRRVHVEYEEVIHDAYVELRVEDRWRCDLWTIPFTGREMAEVTPEWLLEESREPRPTITVEADERPEMPLYEDHVKKDRAVTNRPDKPSVEGEIGDEGVEWLLKETLQMPCLYENLLLDPEPPHKVRLNAAIRLLNVGFGPEEVTNIFAQIGWTDFSRAKTLKFVRHAYRKGYTEMNCQTLRNEGYCTRADDPTDCRTYGWSGGEAEWRDDG